MKLTVTPRELKEKLGIDWEDFAEITGRDPLALEMGIWSEDDEFEVSENQLLDLQII